MASGTQLGATRARFSWEDCGRDFAHWTGGLQTLPVVEEAWGDKARVFIGFHPFASHVIVAQTWHDAYEAYIGEIEHLLALDDNDLATIAAEVAAGKDHDEVLASWDATYSPSGTVIVDHEVTVTEVPVAAMVWLAPAP